MKNLKKGLNWQIILIIFVNLFIANQDPFGIIIIGALGMAVYFGGEKYYWAGILFYLYFFFSILRLSVLPLLYTYLEKHSKLETVHKFIYALKTNRKLQLLMLVGPICFFLTEILFLNRNNISYLFSDFVSFVFAFIVFILIFSLSTSYLVLFLWWKYKGELK